MVRLAFFASLFLLVLVFLVGASSGRPLAVEQFSPGASSASRTFREARVLDLLKVANSRRAQLGLGRLTVLPELQLALDDFASSGAEGGVEGALRLAENRIPAVRSLSANLVYGGGEEIILADLGKWGDLVEKSGTHLALQFFDDPKDGRTGCIAVLASVFPEFRPPMRSMGINAFFDVCRWCGRGHGISVAGGGQTTLVIQCPDCDRTCDLVATDSDGYWRRVTQFLHPQGGQPGAGTLDEVMSIWSNLTSRNRYQKDAERLGGSDSWNLPEETMRRGTGDCEDTSLLLAQLLLERGYEVRVVLGKQKGRGHAWCVLKLGGKSYLLESTCPAAGLSRPPLISECGLDYEPEFQFDAVSMYFKDFQGWTSEYWDDHIWEPAPAQDWMSASL